MPPTKLYFASPVHLAAGEIHQKSPGDVVTIADQEAEKALTRGLIALRRNTVLLIGNSLATVVAIAATDVRGGTGANFVVDWAAAGEIAEPAVEALMVGSVGNGHYAFISQGRPIKIIKN